MLIWIINNSNYIDVTLLIDVHEGDDIFYQKDITKYNVSIEKENINFDITENVITEYDMSINITRNYEVKIDELVLRSSAKEVGLTNIKKLFNIINDNYNDSTTEHTTAKDDDAELMKSTLKKELKFKAKKWDL